MGVFSLTWHKTLKLRLLLQRLKMKRALVDKGYWENVVDNRQDAKAFTSDFKDEYANALKSLQHQLAVAGKIG
jgi:hypothetical protein